MRAGSYSPKTANFWVLLQREVGSGTNELLLYRWTDVMDLSHVCVCFQGMGGGVEELLEGVASPQLCRSTSQRGSSIETPAAQLYGTQQTKGRISPPPLSTPVELFCMLPFNSGCMCVPGS